MAGVEKGQYSVLNAVDDMLEASEVRTEDISGRLEGDV
jgi:hypothetical protein